ncbi:hypothetical protein [Methylobacterium sp. SD21]|uniref:hypothetical protein n=1 Tax=Methylobacterium litchii TaxID=3138810 RepID=UPI00313CFE11
MTPAEYVDEIVVPTIVEFLHEPASRRRAYLACIVTNHVRDHLFTAGKRNVDDVMRANAYPHFAVVKAVCNGIKHVKRDRSSPIKFGVGEDVDPREVALSDENGNVLTDENGDTLTIFNRGRGVENDDSHFILTDAVTQSIRVFKEQYQDLLVACDLTTIDAAG